MVLNAFYHRSGRVVATSRVVLAATFLVASWLDPTTPGWLASLELAILGGYVSAAAIYLALTWSNWRLESRLAGPAHLADIALFTVLVFLTEGYTSPFFPFYVFLLLSATMRWNWRITAATAVGVIFLYVSAGAAAIAWAGGDFDLLRLVFRGAMLGVISLVLIWFGINQQIAANRQLTHPDLRDEAGAGDLPIRPALEWVTATTQAQRTVLAWWDEEEPWTYTAELDEEDGFRQERHRPDAFGSFVAPELDGCVFLFGSGSDVLAAVGRRPRLFAAARAIDPALRDRLGIDSGLAIPVEAGDHRGVLFALGMPGLCIDDIAVGEQLGKEVSAAIQHAVSTANAREAAVARTRLGLTRDFHDRFLQLIAGAALRIEGIRKTAAAGRPVDADLDSLRDELSSEQRGLRRLIDELRGSARAPADTRLCATIHALAERLSVQWGVSCGLSRCCESLNDLSRLEHDLHHLIHEAVANAVRHGRATHVTISLTRDQAGAIMLEIADDGLSFHLGATTVAEPLASPMPWSLHERVHGLGGHLALVSGDCGSRLTILLPEEAFQ